MDSPPRSSGRPIGVILMAAGRISPENAARILKLQKEACLPFGAAAIQLGLLDENDIRFALAQQFDYAYLPPADERPASEELVAAYRPFSPPAEQLRALRTQLLLRGFDREAGRRLLAIVGTGRGEGRSFVAANLAVVFSQLGERTLLVDADLRAPRQHALFKLDNRSGLSSFLSGRAAGEAAVPIAALAKLALLPAGPLPPNPLELLNRPAFGRLLAAAAGDYDVVIIDTPAAASGADASLIARRAGAALAVACRHRTQLAAFADFTRALAGAGVALVGSVYNAPATHGAVH